MRSLRSGVLLVLLVLLMSACNRSAPPAGEQAAASPEPAAPTSAQEAAPAATAVATPEISYENEETEEGTDAVTEAARPTPATQAESLQEAVATSAPAATMADGATPSATIEVRNVWIRASAQSPAAERDSDRSGQAPVTDENDSAAFMTLVNTGNAPDRLTSVQTDAAANVAFFTMRPGQQDTPVSTIDIPASGQVELTQGPGYHMVLQNLTRPLQVGDTVALTLVFENAGQMTIQAPVQQARPGRNPERDPGQGQNNQGQNNQGQNKWSQDPGQSQNNQGQNNQQP